MNQKRKRNILLAVLILSVLSPGAWNLPAVEKWWIGREARRIKSFAEVEAFAKKYDFGTNVLNLPGEKRMGIECYSIGDPQKFYGSKVIYLRWEGADDRNLTIQTYEYEAHINIQDIVLKWRDRLMDVLSP